MEELNTCGINSIFAIQKIKSIFLDILKILVLGMSKTINGEDRIFNTCLNGSFLIIISLWTVYIWAPTPPSRVLHKIIFKWSTASLNLDFPSQLVALPRLQNQIFPTIYPLLRRENIDSRLFQGHLHKLNCKQPRPEFHLWSPILCYSLYSSNRICLTRCQNLKGSSE